MRTAARPSFTLCRNTWVAAPIVLVAAVLAVPYLLTHDFLPLGLALQRGFSLVCHQRPERSFWIAGVPVAVCARCLAIYLGAAIGLMLRTSRGIAIRLLIAAAALNVADAVTEFAGLHSNWILVRFVLGVALGVAGAMLISAASGRREVGIRL